MSIWYESEDAENISTKDKTIIGDGIRISGEEWKSIYISVDYTEYKPRDYTVISKDEVNPNQIVFVKINGKRKNCLYRVKQIDTYEYILESCNNSASELRLQSELGFDWKIESDLQKQLTEIDICLFSVPDKLLAEELDQQSLYLANQI